MVKETVRAVVEELASDFEALNGSFDEDHIESGRRLDSIDELLSQAVEKLVSGQRSNQTTAPTRGIHRRSHRTSRE